MSTPSQRTAAIVVALATLGLAGWVGWERFAPPATKHVEMKAATPATGEETRTASAAPASVAAPSRPVPVPTMPMSPAAKSEASAPSFDVVRVEPSGDALLAGRSTPDSTVALVDRGRVVAETKSDSAGNFVMTPPTLKPGGYSLSLREGQGAAARDSKQSVVVSVPPSKSEPVVVAMAEPGKATALLSRPPEVQTGPEPQAPKAATGPAAPVPGLAIRSVELENGSGLFASGVAPPGRDVRLYLNDSRVADVAAAPKGDWTVTVRKGLAAGHYAVRADMLERDQHVESRVEVPFDVPAPASAAAAAPLTESNATPTQADKDSNVAASEPAGPGHAVVDALQTELVARGDNLWRISRKRLGQGTRYTLLYAANVSQIRDPNLIYPGQVFVLPHE